MRYFIAFVTALGLLFLLVFLLFHGGGSKPKITAKSLATYANSSTQAQLTIDGPINAEQSHQAVRITVANDQVTFEQIQGYQGSVKNLQSFASNQDAYVNFLLALQHAGFTLGNNASALKDERGYCPLGDRYIFRLTQNGQDLERYWATSCGKPKTYLGSISLTLALFQAQVPGYNQLVQGIQF